jgi:hypothetical protein
MSFLLCHDTPFFFSQNLCPFYDYYVFCWSEERWAGIETIHISRHKNTTCFSGASADSLCVLSLFLDIHPHKRDLMASSELQIAKLEAFQFARWFRRVVYHMDIEQ